MDIVHNSSSLYSTYISTVDHLPCDIVRSLWLVQTCNLTLDKEKHYFHQLLQKHNLVGGNGSVAQEFYLRKRLVLRWHDEAVAELVSLCNQLAAHEKMVKDEIAQLQAVADTPVAKDTDMLERLRSQLRNQLRDHYRENPLSSQVEALHEHERVIQDLGRVVIKKTVENGIKIIFKLSAPKIERRGRPKLKAKVETARSKEPRSSREHLRASKRLRGARGEAIEAKGEVSGPKMAKPQARADVEKIRHLRTSARLQRDSRVVETPREIKPVVTKPIKQVPKLRYSAKPVVPKIVKPMGRKRGRPAKIDRTKLRAVAQNIPEPVLQASVQEEDTALYCFCKQRSFGDMIACDYGKCPNGEWFHYKCVGLLNRVEALKYTTEKWYCSAGCREAGSAGKNRGRKKKGRW